MNEFAFYSTLLSVGGAWVMEFVAKHMRGPSVDVIRRWRNERVLNYSYGDEEWRVKEQVSRVAEMLKKEWGTGSMEGVISEDGSALLDYLEAHPTQEGDVQVWGLSGGPVTVNTVEDLERLMSEKKSATTFYPYLWVPLAPGAKALPLMVVCHDNTKEEMSVSIMVKRWKTLWKCCAEAGLTPVAHYGDGDPRVRAASIWLGTTGTASIRIDHPLVNMHVREENIQLDNGTTAQVHVTAGIDPLHIDWRLLRQYLDAKR